ncbi:MAG: cytochrome c3 family protein [Candidatus Mariimomonas ferrooxydans]
MSKKNYPVLISLLTLAIIAAFGTTVEAGIKISSQTKKCLVCHEPPGIVKPWEGSRHAVAGVGCYECHQAKRSDVDAQNHNGFTISVIVSPKDCSRCHPQQVEEFSRSRHAKANKFIGSLNNILGSMVIGDAGFDLGCAQCHGSNVTVGKNGKPVVGPWPNSGVGRLNPDGSNGSCVACHQRHAFSVEQARDPYTCGRCHQGPEHPQIEIFLYSKHGISWHTFKDRLNITESKWVLGEDYFLAPTCATCHMGQTTQLDRTHDVGERIAWTLRPVISKRLPDWEEKRENMKAVCSECHKPGWYEGFFTQFDRYVELYNEKFARPAQDIIKFLKAEKVIDPTPFNEQVEIDFWHLWHREGRKGRHGAAMNAPDWAMTGLTEVAFNFYSQLIPHAEEAVEKKGSELTKTKWKNMKNEILNRKEHKWRQGLPMEELRKTTDFYQKRYGEEGAVQ